MPNSPGSLDARACATGTMRLASAIQHLSPSFSSEVNALIGAGPPADASCSTDSAGPTYQEQSRRGDNFVSHGLRLQKHSVQTCCEEAEEDQDDDEDELVILFIDEAISAVFGAAAGRSLPQQAREALVPPSSEPSPPKACDKTTTRGGRGGGGTELPAGGDAGGRGVSARGEGQWVEREDVAGTSCSLPENEWSVGQATRSTRRVSPASSSGATSDNSSCDSTNGNVSSSSVVHRCPPFVESRNVGGGGGSAPLRRLLWLRLLGVLQDADPLKWAQQLQQQRAAYVRLQEEEERQLSAKRLTSLDPQRFHPLAATADNPWSQRQQNEALLLEIWKDVERTLAERRLFRSDATRKALQRILFTWSRRNPEVSYKQGMNELLAIFYLVCYREKLQAPSSEGNTSSSSGSSKSSDTRSNRASGFCNSSGHNSSTGTSSAADEVLHQQQLRWREREAAVQILLSPDPAATEADSFALFDAVMNRFMLKAAYLPAPCGLAAAAAGAGTSLLHKGSSSSGRFLGGGGGLTGGLPPLVARSSIAAASKSALLWRCSYIFETLLPFADRPLYEHLKSEEVEPQLFLLRWIRLLFSREFHIEDTLLLWDALFADAYLHEAIERGGHTPSYSCHPSSTARQSVSAPAAAACCAETEGRTAAAGADALCAATASPGGPMVQQQQQQQLSSVTGGEGGAFADPFRSLLRCTPAPAGTAAAEVMYDPEQVGAAAAAKLPLVDYFVLAMLKYVRVTLLESNQILCLRRLLRFPPTESIQPLVLLAVSLRTRRLPHVGRPSVTGTPPAPQQPVASPIERQGPTFPSIFSAQTQPHQRRPQQPQQLHGQQQQQGQDSEQQVHEQQQQLQEQRQQPQKEEPHQQEEAVMHPVRAGTQGPQLEATAEPQQQQQESSPATRTLQHAAQGKAQTTFSPPSPAAPGAPSAAAGAAAAHTSQLDSPRPTKETHTSASTHKRGDLLLTARLCATTSPLLGFPPAAAAAAGGSEQPLIPAPVAADLGRRGDVAAANSNSDSSTAGGKGPGRKSLVVNVDLRHPAAEKRREAATGAAGACSSNVSSWLRESSDTEACAGDGASHVIAGRTISRHVEEVAADIRAALALWSSKELLAHQNSTREMMGVAPGDERAVQQTFSSFAQRMQAAEERIAAALVRLQLLHRVLEGDIAYSSSLFPPAANSNLCAGGEGARPAAAAAVPVEGAAGAMSAAHSSSRNEYVGEHLAGGRAATPATVR